MYPGLHPLRPLFSNLPKLLFGNFKTLTPYNPSQRLLRKASRHLTWRLGRTLCFYDLPKLLFGTFKPLEPLAAPPAMPQRLLRKASHAISPGALAAPRRSSSASETASEGLSHHVTWRLGRTLCFYDLPKLLFGTLKCLEPLAAPPAMPQRLLRKASHAISPGAFRTLCFYFRNCFLAPSNAWNPSQRLQQCPRDCFGRPLTPSHLAPWPQQAPETASEGLSPSHLAPWPHTLFLWPSKTAFWHLQTLGTPRSASSNAPETASEGLSRHLTWRLGRTLCFYFRNCFLTPSNAWNPSQRLQQCPRDCFGRPLTPSHLAPWPHTLFLLPKLLFGTLKCLEPLAAPPAMPQRLLRKASHAISPGALAAHSAFMTFRNCFLAPSLAAPPAGPRDCFGRPLAISPGALAAHSVFMTFQNCFLAPSNPWNPSQRLQQCPRDCFGRSLTPCHLAPWPHTLFLWPSETAFWHPQMLGTPRSASSSASESRGSIHRKGVGGTRALAHSITFEKKKHVFAGLCTSENSANSENSADVPGTAAGPISPSRSATLRRDEASRCAKTALSTSGRGSALEARCEDLPICPYLQTVMLYKRAFCGFLWLLCSFFELFFVPFLCIFAPFSIGFSSSFWWDSLLVSQGVTHG